MTDLYQKLLGMMAGGQPGPDRQALLGQMLAEQGVDPSTQQLLSQIMAQNTAEEPDEDDPDGDQLAARRKQAVRVVRRHVEAIEAELDELRERNDRLAAALGACYDCWGEDAECDLCRGAGRPGNTLPDARLFKQLVDPAVRAVQAERARRRLREPDRLKGGPE